MDINNVEQTLTSVNDFDLKKTKAQDIMINNERKDYYMSFVGVIKCKDGILAFGDKRSSLNEKLDIERGSVQKVFYNDKYVVCTFGNNTLMFNNIESILSELIEKEKLNYNDFIKKFIYALKMNNDKREFNLIIHQFDNDKIEHITFNNFKIENIKISYNVLWCINLITPIIESYIKNKNINFKYMSYEEIIALFKENIVPICKTIDDTKLYIGVSPEFDFIYKEKDKKPIKLSI